ncbi:hypothetical protein CL6EHI_c00090 [Entamoeba histolytica]|uniref:Uncharacterized protein n=1 Tax=Entamoeba histolytica TaxID=5759 RepID=A0A175JMS5_ENTHI|nr:hypothetical protein CL6EHI_c00090 [Entamoeba histolytica]
MNLRNQINLLEQRRIIQQQRRNNQKDQFYLNNFLKGSITSCDVDIINDLTKCQKEQLKDDLNYMDYVFEKELQELEVLPMECE